MAGLTPIIERLFGTGRQITSGHDEGEPKARPRPGSNGRES